MAKTKNQINKLTTKAIYHLKKYFNIKEVILFGSQFIGKPDEFSDIDLAVISPDFEKKHPEEEAGSTNFLDRY